jgi:hypothetical protein
VETTFVLNAAVNGTSIPTSESLSPFPEVWKNAYSALNIQDGILTSFIACPGNTRSSLTTDVFGLFFAAAQKTVKYKL